MIQTQKFKSNQLLIFKKHKNYNNFLHENLNETAFGHEKIIQLYPRN